MKILSIDAWAEPEGGWTWNDWSQIGTITKEEFEAIESYLKWFKDNGYTTTTDKRKVAIDDDQYNIVLCDAKDMRPLYAIEYGPEY